jgi:hypothetical protein
MNDPSTWAASKTECARYAGIFRTVDTDNDGLVTGGEARPIFLRSNLPGPDLAAIWALCDTNHSGRLNVRQFALGLWLCNARMRGAPLLQALPPRLVASLQAGGYEFVGEASSSQTPPPTATAPQQQAPPRSSSAASLLDLMM